MGKAKESPLQMLQLDIQYRDRQLAADIAMHNAEIAYKTSYMNLVDVPALEEQKQEFAQNYALEQAQFAFSQEMAKAEFGESQRQFDITNALNQARLQLEQEAQAFTEKIQTGQLELNTASITGFFQGAPTLDRIKMEAGLTGYYNGMPTFEREQFEKNFAEQQKEFQQQFGLSQAQTFLNAPRGPADYSAYINRLTGLQNQGYALPGAVNQLLQGQTPGTTGANTGPLPMSGTQYAQSLIYGTPVAQNAQQTVPTSGQAGSTNPVFSAAAGGTTMGTGTTPTASALPRAEAGGTIQGGQDVDFRDWEKLSPVTQQFTTGYAEENMGIPAQDFLWGIAQGAPQTQQATTAKRSVF